MSKGKVLILEDDVVLADQVALILNRYNYEVLITANSDVFFEELRVFNPDVILLDVFLVGSKLNGIQVLKHLKDKMDLNYKVIVISGEVSTSQVQEIRDLGAYHFIEKGSSFSTNQLLLHIDNAITLKRQEEEHIGLQIEYINMKKQFTRSFPFIGESPAIKQVREKIRKLAEVDEDLFLIGETGTGKEVGANYYYISSQRFGKPFHTLNCSALTETLIESELFGHVKGSFTSADRNKTGFFEECSNGLLFLDEVTNLSLIAQSKILRAIENKEIQVVGGPMKKVNTRLIFASNAKMDILSDSEKFRRDLFYRIEGNIVELPPLRERGEDILPLMSFFLTNFSNQYSINDHLDLTTLKSSLLSYSWPGNIRELRNFCKFMMINERNITNETILKHLEHKLCGRDKDLDCDNSKYLEIPSLKESIARYERDYLIHHLERNNWLVSKTARAIGIERTTLYKKIKQLNINNPTEE
ncbi:MAG: sigma-54 dependent transcriptional regulator [Candidatus Cloacimonetes bacterium]|jgi:two-component system nitrogen regulation response regulator NtrX|nr:sigma-54 dependent transcriptional regulator [Candidatus Cloacimonadota bacterium]MDY0298465.1 sigma-54 dependent transcriptional regulator [Candidatus Cloacimonadaceae bacterium]MCB5278835.1 sigma-54 dependent transcriptional regulator [Candidatus Cloacimonadota bacterium]MCK9332264.1 sigma-54 dependent transcriptional regulator [Candidatus Cloacimonadota bacterium]MDD2210126.1 sigma-54 dependent transcriptional regulator [Candidatus Cloacimonadota bacterium]